MEKEGLLRDLKREQAGEVEDKRKIVDLEDQALEEISMFKLVKYKQGYRDWAQGKLLRYPLEADVAEGDQAEFVPSVSVVPPPLGAPEMIIESSRSPPVSGTTMTPLVEPTTEAVEEPSADDVITVTLM